MFGAPSVPHFLTDDKRWEDFFFPGGGGCWQLGKGAPLGFLTNLVLLTSLLLQILALVWRAGGLGQGGSR